MRSMKMLSKYYKLLARDGKIIITTPHRSGPYRDQLVAEHVRDVMESDFSKYTDVKVDALFYGDYAIPIWNLVVISK